MTLQPDPDPQHRTLVEREGVNAGSDASTVESDRNTVSPHVTPDYDDSAARRTSADDENGALPAPDTDAVESGQDNGSMD